MRNCFVKKYRAGFAKNESNALLEEYLDAFVTVLGHVLGIRVEDLKQAEECVKNHDALPLGFAEWFWKYGKNMLSRMSSYEFREKASDEFLDELNYYSMSLKETQDNCNHESICSDLVASLTRLNKMLTSELLIVKR